MQIWKVLKVFKKSRACFPRPLFQKKKTKRVPPPPFFEYFLNFVLDMRTLDSPNAHHCTVLWEEKERILCILMTKKQKRQAKNKNKKSNEMEQIRKKKLKKRDNRPYARTIFLGTLQLFVLFDYYVLECVKVYEISRRSSPFFVTKIRNLPGFRFTIINLLQNLKSQMGPKINKLNHCIARNFGSRFCWLGTSCVVKFLIPLFNTPFTVYQFMFQLIFHRPSSLPPPPSQNKKKLQLEEPLIGGS